MENEFYFTFGRFCKITFEILVRKRSILVGQAKEMLKAMWLSIRAFRQRFSILETETSWKLL